MQGVGEASHGISANNTDAELKQGTSRARLIRKKAYSFDLEKLHDRSMKARRSLILVGMVLSAFTCVMVFVFAWMSTARFDPPSLHNELSLMITTGVEPALRSAEYAEGLQEALIRVSSTWLLLD